MNKKLGHDAIYDARELGVPRMLLLGLQHLFAMFGATVLVPILVTGYGLPLSIQTTLLFAGIGTLMFHICTKFKVPAFLGSSFAFLGGFQAVANLDSGKFAAMTGEEKLPYALGGVVVAGLLYLVLALLFKLVGAKKVMRYFPPIVTGPIIILIGLNLSGTAVTNASTCWWLALVAIAIIIVANIWGKGMIKIIPILLGVIALSGSLGTPWPWLRLSVIGALHYETQVAQAAAEQVGMHALSAAEMTPQGFATIALLMSICIMWGMILSIFFNKRYLKRLGNDGAKSASGVGFGDSAMTAMFIGLVCAYIGSYIGAFVSGEGLFTCTGDWTPLIVVAVSAAVMALFVYLSEKKNMAWLESFSIAGSMLIGMAAAVLVRL